MGRTGIGGQLYSFWLVYLFLHISQVSDHLDGPGRPGVQEHPPSYACYVREGSQLLTCGGPAQEVGFKRFWTWSIVVIGL